MVAETNVTCLREIQTSIFLKELFLHYIIKRDIFTAGLLCFIVGILSTEHLKTWSECKKTDCTLGLVN